MIFQGEGKIEVLLGGCVSIDYKVARDSIDIIYRFLLLYLNFYAFEFENRI